MSTSAPNAASQEPPKQFPFVIPPSFKKLHSIDTQGEELFSDENLWVRMQLKDPFQQATNNGDASGIDNDGEGNEAAQQKDEEAVNPFEVMGLFNNAKRELEWLQLMLRFLKDGKYLTVGRIERPPVPQRMMDLAVEVNSRYKRRTAAAAAASASLAEGAAALQALGSREDAFYLQVAQLQKYWKVKQEPPDSPYAYTVNLKLSSSSSSSGGEDTDLAAAAAMIGHGPVSMIPILKDSNGMLRVQVPALRRQQQQQPPTVMVKETEEPPMVCTGPAAIHSLLLQQLRLNAWHLVLQSLDSEITQRLGLPARLQPSRAAAAAGGNPAAAVAAAAAAAALDPGPDRQASNNSSGSTAAAAAAVSLRRLQGSLSSSSRSGAGSHFTFYATLSNLVLQAVIGSAATAGEDALLEQQQQQRPVAAAAAAAAPGASELEQQQQQRQRSKSPGDNGSLSVGSLTLELDVGGPWERAAAAAAAGSSNGSLLYQPPATVDSSSSSIIVLDPQLLSLRPLALQHLSLTQLGHLITKSYYQDRRPIDNAAIAFAAAAREQQQRHRQRQQQAGLTAAVAAASSSSRPSVLMLPAVSFMTCLSRWLAHSSSRELTRAKIDQILLKYPGIVAKTLPCCHSCNSVIAIQQFRPPARSTNSSSDEQLRHQQQQQQCGSLAAAPLLMLLSDAGLVIEGAGLGATDVGNASGQHSRSRDVQQSVNHLVALPGIMQPLLNAMQQQ